MTTATIKKILLACCLAAVAIVPSYVLASKHSHSNSSQQKKIKNIIRGIAENDPIIGPWQYSYQVAGNTVEGVIVFHAGGTLIYDDASKLTQSLLLIAPTGNFYTKDVGSWKKTDKRLYKYVSSAVLLVRQGLCTPSTVPDCLAFPAFPLFRTKSIVKNFTISEDGQMAAGTITTTTHPVDDLTLKIPGIDPTTGEPIPVIIGTIFFQKLNFHNHRGSSSSSS